VETLSLAIDDLAARPHAAVAYAGVSGHHAAHARHGQAAFPRFLLLVRQRGDTRIDQYSLGHGRGVGVAVGLREAEDHHLQVHADLLANKVGRIHIKDRRGQFDAATIAEIDDSSMIGDDCQIKPGAQIINSVLGQGCFVEERARVENSVIWPHTRIGTTAQVTGAIVGRGCHIGRSAVVGPGSALGDKTSLTDYTITGVSVS